MSIALNAWLVPKWDINGGALANVGSYLVYFVLLLAFIKWKIGVHPLSVKMLPVAMVVLVLFALNWLWTVSLTPWFSGFFENPIFGLGIDAVLKTMIFVIIGMTAIYKLRISKSVNDLVEKGLGKLKK